MQPSSTPKRNPSPGFLPSRWKRLLAAAFPVAVICGGLCLSQSAHAAPLAGSSIGNQATATYSDGSDTERFAQSNTVTTKVLQVPSVDLVQDNAVIRTAGAPVYFPHTITNTGNGPDFFDIDATDLTNDQINILSGAEIYTDTNDDGVPDGVLTDTDGDGVPNTPSLAPGATFKFIVVGRVPNNAANGNQSNVRVDVTGNYTGTVQAPVAAATDSNTDNVTVTTNAAITVTKKQSLASGGPGSTVTYTLEYTNTGNQAATDLEITDVLDANLVYVGNSGRWSGSGTTVLGDGGSDTDPSGITYSVSGQTVKAVIASVAANTTGRVSFSVTVKAGTIPGQVPNTADFDYDDDASTTTPDRTGKSNIVNFNVSQVPSLTFVGETKNTANQGDVVVFNNTLTNTGNGKDTFDIVVNGPGTFPTGTAFQLFQSDGVTALLDTNNNQIPDTGEVAANGQYIVVLKAILPPSAQGNNNNAGFTVTKTATSNGTGKPTATATDKLNEISGATVNLTNLNDADGNASTGVPVTTATGAPGTTQTFTLNVINTSSKADTYSFAVSTTNAFAPTTPLPAGFTVVFKDANGTTVSNTGSIPGVSAAPNNRKAFTAEVFIPADASPQDVNLFFRVISGSTGASDVKLDRVTVSRVRSIAVEPDNSGQAYFNSTIVFPHTVTNTGNQTETNVAITTSGDTNGFQSVAYLDSDNDGELDPAEAATPLTSIASIAPGQTINVLVKVFTPADGAPNLTNVTTLTATLNGVAIAESATDTTTIVVGDVKLDKEQTIDPDGSGPTAVSPTWSKAIQNAKPGAYIRYRITVTNTGAGDVTNVRVTDSIPPFTTYFQGDNSTSALLGRAVWTADGTTFNNPEATAQTPANNGTGTFTFLIPRIASKGSVTITFGVKVAE